MAIRSTAKFWAIMLLVIALIIMAWARLLDDIEEGEFTLREILEALMSKRLTPRKSCDHQSWHSQKLSAVDKQIVE